MLPGGDLESVLPSLPRKTVHGPWSRAVGYHLLTAAPPGAAPGSGPQPLWPGGPVVTGGRFTPKGGHPSVYLAEDPVLALKEVQAVFAPDPSIALRTQPWVLVTVDGIVSDIVDLTDTAMQATIGTDLTELTGDWLYPQSLGLAPPTQLLGQLAFETGVILGLRYPSAKDPANGVNLIVFADRLASHAPSRLEVFDPHEKLVQSLP